MSEIIVSEISKNYSKALLQLAIEQDKSDLFSSQLDELISTFESSEDLKVVMSNSSVSAIKKIEILNEIFSGKIDEKLLNLLKVLVEKNRFAELNSINLCYKQMNQKQENKRTVEVISPTELSQENKDRVLAKLKEKLNNEILPIWSVDDSLIAGLVFKFDDYVIDTSVRAKLENLSKILNR